MNGTATTIKLVCVRSQKRTQAEQEIPELSTGSALPLST